MRSSFDFLKILQTLFVQKEQSQSPKTTLGIARKGSEYEAHKTDVDDSYKVLLHGRKM